MKNALENLIIRSALTILKTRLRQPGQPIDGAETARQFLILTLANRESEVFAVLFLDNDHRLISFDEMFFGTIDSAAVYPREVVKAALRYNAASVVLAHNHPSARPVPSQADMRITERLQAALELIDVRVLDHFIVAGTEVFGFAESGLLT